MSWRNLLAEGGKKHSEINLIDELLANPTTFSVFLAALALFTLGFELVTHGAEHALHSNPYMLSALHHMYRELMTLGVISFTLVVTDFSGLAEAVAKLAGGKFNKLVFEITHILIFLVMSIFVILSAFVMVVATRVANSWSRLEKEDPAKYKKIDDDLQIKLGRAALPMRPFFKLKIYNNKKNVDYFRTRTGFIRDNQLHNSFDFAKYLRHSTRATAVSLIEIPWKFWLFVFFLAPVNVLLVKILGLTDKFILSMWIIVNFFSLLLSVLFLMKSLMIKDKLDTVIRTPTVLDVAGGFNRRRALTKSTRNAAVEARTKRDDTIEGEKKPEGMFAWYTHASGHQRLFWLRSEVVMLKVLQSIVFIQALLLSVYFLGLNFIAVRLMGVWSPPLMLLPSLVLLLVVLPEILSVFALVTSVGENARISVIAGTAERTLDAAMDTDVHQMEEHAEINECVACLKQLTDDANYCSACGGKSRRWKPRPRSSALGSTVFPLTDMDAPHDAVLEENVELEDMSQKKGATQQNDASQKNGTQKNGAPDASQSNGATDTSQDKEIAGPRY